MAHGIDFVVAGELAVVMYRSVKCMKNGSHWFQTCYSEVSHLVAYACVECYICKTVLHYKLAPKLYGTLLLWQLFHEGGEGCERGCRMLRGAHS